MSDLILPPSLRDRAVRPGDRRYPLLRSTYTTVSAPALVLLPESPAEVAAALEVARDSGLPLSVRCGGHGLSGRSSNDGGIVLDVSAFGGVGGLATAGGIGWLARSYGLAIDHIRAVDVVLPDGRLVHADTTHEPDLYWAVRGDGVGVALAFEMEATPLRTVGFGQVTVTADRDGKTLRRWSEYLAAAPHELTGSAMVFPDGKGFVAQFMGVVATDDQDRGRDLVPTGHLHPNTGQQPATTTNALLPELTADSARALMDVAAGRERTLLQLRALGGAINDVAPDAAAYAHRHQQVLAILAEFPPGRGAGLDTAAARLAPYADGACRNFESRPDGDSFRRAFPGATGERGRALRERYDPDGLLQRVATAATVADPVGRQCGRTRTRGPWRRGSHRLGHDHPVDSGTVHA